MDLCRIVESTGKDTGDEFEAYILQLEELAKCNAGIEAYHVWVEEHEKLFKEQKEKGK